MTSPPRKKSHRFFHLLAYIVPCTGHFDQLDAFSRMTHLPSKITSQKGLTNYFSFLANYTEWMHRAQCRAEDKQNIFFVITFSAHITCSHFLCNFLFSSLICSILSLLYHINIETPNFTGNTKPQCIEKNEIIFNFFFFNLAKINFDATTIRQTFLFFSHPVKSPYIYLCG